MITLSKQKDVVGLDLEAGSIAATQVHMNGGARVTAAGVLSIPAGVVHEGEVVDADALAQALKQLFADNKLSKQVRLGIANQRVVVRTLRFPQIEKASDLETAIRFQAQDHIPMPLDQAVLDYEVIGRSEGGEAGQPTMDVVAVAARREMISQLVGAMRKAGLRPIGIDLSAFGMIRGLAGQQGLAATPGLPSYEERMANPELEASAGEATTLYANLGDVTNLAIARGTRCVFTRVSQFGIEGVAQRLAERGGLTLDHARQWLTHVGIAAPVEEIEGDPETVGATRAALAEGTSKLVDEIRLSLDYYAAQEGAQAVETVVACGAGTTIPGLCERVERELGIRVVSPRPEALAHLDPSSAARLTLSYGLATER